MSEMESLPVDNLYRHIDEETFDFSSTEELDELDEVIGQERAVESVKFGVDIGGKGYNIFALGSRGTGKQKTIEDFLRREAKKEDTPDDWVYVNNFQDSDQPRAIQLPTGKGRTFYEDIEKLVNELKSEVPQSFDSEEYKQEREELQKEFEKKRKELMEELEREAQKKNFTLLQTPGGTMLAPLVDGEVMTPDEFSELEDDKRKVLEDRREELQDIQEDIQEKIQEKRKEAREKIRDLDRRVIRHAVEGLITELKDKYSDLEEVVEFLDEVLEDLLKNVDVFKQLKQMESGQMNPMQMMMQGGQEPSFDKYRVNLLVENEEGEGAPVVYESNPTYYNLLGRIEHEGQMGQLTTDFTMIKEGALHQANGGYLLIDAKDLLSRPFAYEALKRVLRNQQIKTETMGQEYRAIQTRTLEPETIPLDVTVVLLGSPYLYYTLYNLDEDFEELFKVKADFADDTDFTEDIPRKYARFVASVCNEFEDCVNFKPSGVARLLEEGIRQVADQEKISTRFRQMDDIVRQAGYWAQKDGDGPVDREDVQKAVDHQIYRSNRVEERIHEMIEDGTILIDTEGEQIGQVNGISVTPLGDYAFGKPSRITATTHAGREGVVNIDREAELGGRIHSKGVMILKGYLGSVFAREQPLAFSASITFEQVYSEIDGDSASSTELYALLSSLADLPIRQDLAVTGSVNQRGQVQAIGGVNHKIEGHFKVCRRKGLTGEQGVLIPESNVRNLMLREEVLDAVREDRFHIYAVSTIEEGIELLTGTPAGEKQEDGTFPEGTVYHAVQQRLEELAESVKAFSGDEDSTNSEG